MSISLLHQLWRLCISLTRWSNDSLFFGETISGKRASLAHFGRWVGSLLKELTCDKELHNSSVLQQQTPKTRFFKRLRQKTEQQVRKFLNNLKMILCTVIAKNLVRTALLDFASKIGFDSDSITFFVAWAVFEIICILKRGI